MRKLLVGFAFGVLALFSAGHAGADPSDMDYRYLSMLQRDGITASSGASALLEAARLVCDARMTGTDQAEVIHNVWLNTSLDQSGAAALVYDAESVYCPGYLSAKVAA
jgi:hypothetical protein